MEVTAKTVDEAKDAALDQLGVHESDAEFEVLEEPKGGLFGRLRSEARVRARVLPTSPRPKVDRRDRRRSEGRSRSEHGGDRSGERSSEPSAQHASEVAAEARPRRGRGGPGPKKREEGANGSFATDGWGGAEELI
ncbi:MAG: Jag N-terminal domain-containing protein, partial [Acidimicrobiales bacterium]